MKKLNDLESKEHVSQVLHSYPDAMLAITHDSDFLEEIGVNEMVDVGNFNVD